MAVTSFAAISIGSYEVSLDIYEISRKNGIHCIDRIRHRIELGKQPFANSGRISPALMDELCEVLQDFMKTVHMYRITNVRAIATSAIREAANDLFVIGKIRQVTGLDVEILSNSEQRFLSCKSVASFESQFREMIKKGAAIVDLDGGSFQISVYDKSRLITTQNLRQGSLRVRDRLDAMESQTMDYEELVEQLIRYDLRSFRKMYLKDRKIENVIMTGDLLSEMIFRDPKYRDRVSRTIDRMNFENWYSGIVGKTESELATENNMSLENASLLRPSAVIFHRLVEELDGSLIWMPGTSISRGLAYEFAEDNRLLKMSHNFGNDIISASRHLARRYGVSKPHIDNLDMTATEIFDATKRIHGMTSRDGLLLRITVMLHDVGRYISYNRIGENSFNIIISNEIIGLSHAEREIIALASKYMSLPFPEYEELVEESSLDTQRYLKVAYITAIMRLVNALDRSHMQKIQNFRAEVKEQDLVLHAVVRREFVMEKGMMQEEEGFFREVFGLRPVLKIKKTAETGKSRRIEAAFSK